MLFTALMLAGGCSSLIPPAKPDPTRYYILTPPDAAPASGATDASGHVIALRAIELPAFLQNTKSMVTTPGANEVVYHEYHRWAEPLDNGLGRLLREELQRTAGVAEVQQLPGRWERPASFEITIRIHRCDGGDGDGRFAAGYEIVEADTRRLHARKEFVTESIAWDGRDFAALARGLSGAMAQFAAAVAADLPPPPSD